MGRLAGDIDVAVAGDAHAAAERIASAVGGSVFALAEERGTWRVTYGGHVRGDIDLTSLGGTIEADLTRRDFTVDSMAVPVADLSRLVDPYGGAADLDARVIRLTSRDAFLNDGARLLRAVRARTKQRLMTAPCSESAESSQSTERWRACAEKKRPAPRGTGLRCAVERVPFTACRSRCASARRDGWPHGLPSSRCWPRAASRPCLPCRRGWLRCPC